MWHVDEGALHAYLDGALDEYPAGEARRVREHLETCRECTDRLAVERRVREEAQDILGMASPRVEVPSFEELRAYVKAQAPRRTAASARLYRMSWAASVVLALGTGWLLRGGVPPTAVAPAANAFTADSAEEPASTQSTPAAELERPSETAPATGGAITVDQAPTALGPSPQADAPVVARALAPEQPRRETAERLDETGAGSAAGFADAAAADAARKTADDAADVTAADTRRAAPEPAPASAPSATPVAPAVEPSATASRTDDDPTAQDADGGQRAAEQRLRSAIQQAPAVGIGGGAPALGRASAADAPADTSPDGDEEAETLSLVVPGLEVLDVLRVGEGTAFSGTRALQRLPTGDTLETVHLPAGIDPRSLPPLRAGWRELIRSRGSGWLVMRAPVAEATLAELLQRLEGGR
jgi:anti-sigma factor RsiW